jgi:hypothetical protein
VKHNYKTAFQCSLITKQIFICRRNSVTDNKTENVCRVYCLSRKHYFIHVGVSFKYKHIQVYATLDNWGHNFEMDRGNTSVLINTFEWWWLLPYKLTTCQHIHSEGDFCMKKI